MPDRLSAHLQICTARDRPSQCLSLRVDASRVLETGTLYVENLWIAFLLGTLLLTFDYVTTRSATRLAAFAMLCAGAMQTKVIGLIWVAPLLLYVGYFASRQQVGRCANDRSQGAALDPGRDIAGRMALCQRVDPHRQSCISVLQRPFRSPYFDSGSSFTNPLYVVPLRPWSIYELFLSSGRFIEGRDGAAGFHWLLLLPVILLAFLRRRPLAQWLCLALAALFFVAVFSQQAYLRYLLPALLLIAVLGGWALSDLPWTRSARVALLVVGGLLCLLNLQFMSAGIWSNGRSASAVRWIAKFERTISIPIFPIGRLPRISMPPFPRPESASSRSTPRAPAATSAIRVPQIGTMSRSSGPWWGLIPPKMCSPSPGATV